MTVASVEQCCLHLSLAHPPLSLSLSLFSGFLSTHAFWVRFPLGFFACRPQALLGHVYILIVVLWNDFYNMKFLSVPFLGFLFFALWSACHLETRREWLRGGCWTVVYIYGKIVGSRWHGSARHFVILCDVSISADVRTLWKKGLEFSVRPWRTEFYP